ncbi:MAG TPA: TadE/TadG family type IV pilus assembly protein [Kofleriaceae bacterium]|nr:TadE/TadG family type IV pilus assembly protein [Kofleriaceae bacterium]
MARTRSPSQRGSVSVELALVLPLMVIVIIGGVHFGKVLMTRHKLSEATNYATRSAAVARTSNSNQIRGLIQNRMGNSSGCSQIQVTTSTSTDPLGVRTLAVRSRCTVQTGFGGNLFGALGPNQLDVTVAMPF